MMSKKYMKIKRVAIPVISLVIMMSSLVGCSVVKDEELLSMITNGESISIEYAEPDYKEAEIEEVQSFEWVQLDQLQTYNTGFRQSFDDLFNVNIITEESINGKNGVLFVGAEGERNGNATLADAFSNKVFIEKYWNDPKVKEDLAKIADEAYSDLDNADTEKIVAAINAYYNLFPSEVESEAGLAGYLTRGEYLSGFYRVQNRVQDGLQDKEGFYITVGGKTSHTRFVQAVEGFSYLQTSNASLDQVTHNGAVSRIEAVYSIVRALFPEEYESASMKAKSFEDAKNGGDLTDKLGFTGKQRAESYTLAFMIKNPEKGIQEELYKALVVAKEQGIITSKESRWDEPLSKGEAILMMINALTAKNRIDGYVIDKEYGEMIVAEVPKNETPQGDETALSENSEIDEIGIVAIDPNMKPNDAHEETYGQIWKYVDESYRESIRAGVKKNEALEMADVFASIFATSVDDLNRLIGYEEIGYQRPVATKPSAPSNPSTPSNSGTPSTPPTPTTPPKNEPVVSEPKYPISEHGYAITPEDKNGDGILDFLEESYIKSDSTVSVPSGTPNPLTMP